MDLREGTLLREDGTALLFVVLGRKLSLIENSASIDASGATAVTSARLRHLRRTSAGPPISSATYLTVFGDRSSHGTSGSPAALGEAAGS